MEIQIKPGSFTVMYGLIINSNNAMDEVLF